MATVERWSMARRRSYGVVAIALVGATTAIIACSTGNEPDRSQGGAATAPPDAGDVSDAGAEIDWDAIGEDGGYSCWVSQPICQGGQFIKCFYSDQALVNLDGARPSPPVAGCTEVYLSGVSQVAPVGNVFFCCP
jgi:hypothetical protein